jgi:hypothetical protein
MKISAFAILGFAEAEIFLSVKTKKNRVLFYIL